MGMYTKVIVDITIDKSKMTEVDFDMLEAMFNMNTNNEAEDMPKPEHELFDTYRWDMLGHGDSAYMETDVSSWNDLGDNIIVIHNESQLKNYDDEIGKLFNWIDSMGIIPVGMKMGSSLYEENEKYDNYYAKGNK